MYSGNIFDKVLQDKYNGIKIDYISINNLRYADDTAFITDYPEALRYLLNKIFYERDLLGSNIKQPKHR